MTQNVHLSRRYRDRTASNLHSRPSQVQRLQLPFTIIVLPNSRIDQNIALPSHLNTLRNLKPHRFRAQLVQTQITPQRTRGAPRRRVFHRRLDFKHPRAKPVRRFLPVLLTV